MKKKFKENKMKANKTKEELSQQLSAMVDAFVSEGGEITQVPIGVSGSGFSFNALKDGPSSKVQKAQLFGLSRHSKTRPGFHREKILLNEKN